MLKQEFPLKNGQTTFRLVNQKSDLHDWRIANHTKLDACRQSQQITFKELCADCCLTPCTIRHVRNTILSPRDGQQHP